ncbi:thermolabile hemolysin [Haematococcus lacustris]|uniref:Thermolabile hemolysin n=1 Tax=Haematococcus lacustris TaxID=44745 RepID=A0A699YXT8_HAELA|nr:thermolabile hemolysin [Haematococcus lacustris]
MQVGADDYLNQLVNVTEGDRNLGLPGLPLQVVDCIKAAAELSSKFAAQGVYVHVFELGNATNNIINDAFLNNLTDTQHTCLQYGSKAGKALSKIPLVGQKIGELADKVLGSHPEGKCDNPDGFVFWDAVHPTTRMHALTAEALVADLRQLGWWT